MDKLPKVIDMVIEAVSAGELDMDDAAWLNAGLCASIDFDVPGVMVP